MTTTSSNTILSCRFRNTAVTYNDDLAQLRELYDSSRSPLSEPIDIQVLATTTWVILEAPDSELVAVTLALGGMLSRIP